VESGLYIGTSQASGCMVIKNNEIANYLLMFFLDIFSLYTGIAATLVYFAHLRNFSVFYEQTIEPFIEITSPALKDSYGVELYQPID
jgi:hypothetical protein